MPKKMEFPTKTVTAAKVFRGRIRVSSGSVIDALVAAHPELNDTAEGEDLVVHVNIRVAPSQ